MPSFVYPGLSKEEKEKRVAAIKASAQPKTELDGGAAPHKQEAQKAIQKAEVEEIIQSGLDDMKKLDAVKTNGGLVFPKGEVVTVPEGHSLLPKLRTFVKLGTMQEVNSEHQRKTKKG